MLLDIDTILNLVKRKHKKAYNFQEYIIWRDKYFIYNIQLNRSDHTKLEYQSYFRDDYNYDDLLYHRIYCIDNNIIELKNLLGLPVLKKDLTIWLEEKQIDENLYKDLIIPEDNKYWRLYNIIKNLI